jgi:hypothetical protein
MRAHRARRRRREVQLTIEVTETDMREIALAGYADAASTDRKAQAQAVAIFVSDHLLHGVRRSGPSPAARERLALRTAPMLLRAG